MARINEHYSKLSAGYLFRRSVAGRSRKRIQRRRSSGSVSATSRCRRPRRRRCVPLGRRRMGTSAGFHGTAPSRATTLLDAIREPTSGAASYRRDEIRLRRQQMRRRNRRRSSAPTVASPSPIPSIRLRRHQRDGRPHGHRRRDGTTPASRIRRDRGKRLRARSAARAPTSRLCARQTTRRAPSRRASNSVAGSHGRERCGDRLRRRLRVHRDPCCHVRSTRSRARRSVRSSCEASRSARASRASAVPTAWYRRRSPAPPLRASASRSTRSGCAGRRRSSTACRIPCSAPRRRPTPRRVSPRQESRSPTTWRTRAACGKGSAPRASRSSAVCTRPTSGCEHRRVSARGRSSIACSPTRTSAPPAQASDPVARYLRLSPLKPRENVDEAIEKIVRAFGTR